MKFKELLQKVNAMTATECGCWQRDLRSGGGLGEKLSTVSL